MSSSVKLSAPEHPIKAVTVYKSLKAEVVRVFSLQLQSGNTKIDITELPTCIDTHSVRVSGLGEARLFDVVCTTRGGKGTPSAVSEAVRRLRAQKAALQGQKRVRDHESDLLVTYAKTLSGEHVSPTQMGEFLKSFVASGNHNLEAIAEIDEKIVAVDREIEAELEKEASKRGEATGLVTVVVGSDAPTSVELKLTYIVSNATWSSAYELHASTENGKPSSTVSLHYRARIVQSTGEDWTNTALTLSTVDASTLVRDIPLLRAVKIRPNQQRKMFFNNNNASNTNSLFGQPQQQQRPPPGLFGQPNAQPATGGLFGSAPAPGFGAFGGTTTTMPATTLFGGTTPAVPAAATFGGGAPTILAAMPATTALEAPTQEPSSSEEFEEIAIPTAQAGPTTIVTETPLAVSYSVEGKTTVPSDGTAHQVAVASLPFEAQITHICTPRVDARVYLQASVRNTSEYRLLAGPVSVVLNDGFVSKTSVEEIAPGDTFTCTLGDDAGVKVTYARASKTKAINSGSFAEALNSTTTTTKITIHNKHAFKLADLVVRDIVPTSEDARAKVLLHKPAGLADAKEGQVVEVDTEEGLSVRWGKTADGRPGEKEGRIEWAWSVGAGKKVELEAEYELKAPADVSWVEFVPLFA
ncbi:hypothetical protein HMN09_01237900 [Mycena chlorophos]|uniref:DUF4139 domain-containing protein n=1 Tax=Mycena chlorophos TaxID=658473 RepID=A0A8H6VTW9_MYCCL|nr:hypothetical protein HMN09_01237900 [Mycena chlorophos]